MLPLSGLINLSIKKSIGLTLCRLLNLNEDITLWPLWFLFIANFISPLTEEAIKILPLIFSSVRNFLKDKKKALAFGQLFGFGFGIGEAWYLAILFTLQMPELAKGDFWYLLGFFSERSMAIVSHGLLTTIVLIGFKETLPKYYLIAVLFHYLMNLGPALYQKRLISAVIAYIPLIITFLVLFIYVFKIEKQLRKEFPSQIYEKVLFRKEV